ncbi:kinetochore protein Spc25 [Kwoniella heveanensis BCC8398]|uniref:Kinetochore protein SPC25 n=1 Tax=Kwoniella heveanensis BCC8398 TaxID=1296120 RepID=A0A1B9H3S7_9TREE|nr:kinetochore protein Spc25 [Kwoniella heveanensis BCC8398]
MPPSNYLAAPRPVSLQAILDESAANGTAPSIDLQWEPFQRHIEAFLTAIDEYTLAARTELAARASDHTAFMRELQAKKEETEIQIQFEREREGEMLATLESERHAMSDLNTSLSNLKSQLQKVQDQSSTLESELNNLRKEVKLEQSKKERQGKVLDEMRDRDEIELRELEEAVGWKVEGIKEDLLLMRFTLLDPNDPAREFSILIDVSKQDYSVPNCDPSLPSLPELVRQLNSERDFYTFIKRVRKAFRGLIPNPTQPSKFDDLSGPGQAQAQTQTQGQGVRTPAPAGGSKFLLSQSVSRSTSSSQLLSAQAQNQNHNQNKDQVTDGSALEGLTLGK